jgi:hypothetical protein
MALYKLSADKLTKLLRVALKKAGPGALEDASKIPLLREVGRAAQAGKIPDPSLRSVRRLGRGVDTNVDLVATAQGRFGAKRTPRIGEDRGWFGVMDRETALASSLEDENALRDAAAALKRLPAGQRKIDVPAVHSRQAANHTPSALGQTPLSTSAAASAAAGNYGKRLRALFDSKATPVPSTDFVARLRRAARGQRAAAAAQREKVAPFPRRPTNLADIDVGRGAKRMVSLDDPIIARRMSRDKAFAEMVNKNRRSTTGNPSFTVDAVDYTGARAPHRREVADMTEGILRSAKDTGRLNVDVHLGNVLYRDGRKPMVVDWGRGGAVPKGDPDLSRDFAARLSDSAYSAPAEGAKPWMRAVVPQQEARAEWAARRARRELGSSLSNEVSSATPPLGSHTSARRALAPTGQYRRP